MVWCNLICLFWYSLPGCWGNNHLIIIQKNDIQHFFSFLLGAVEIWALRLSLSLNFDFSFVSNIRGCFSYWRISVYLFNYLLTSKQTWIFTIHFSLQLSTILFILLFTLPMLTTGNISALWTCSISSLLRKMLLFLETTEKIRQLHSDFQLVHILWSVIFCVDFIFLHFFFYFH